MKILAPLIVAIGLGLASLAWADPSQTGLEHGKRLGWEKQDCTPHAVPDAGGTLGLLSLGMAGLAFWRLRLVA